MICVYKSDISKDFTYLFDNPQFTSLIHVHKVNQAASKDNVWYAGHVF